MKLMIRISNFAPGLSGLGWLTLCQNRHNMISMNLHDKPLVWLHGEVRTPAFSKEARIEAGFLLRRLQQGERLEMPHSRPMPGIGLRCHELRIVDVNAIWRIVYRVDFDAVVIAEVFKKKSQTTPQSVIELSRKRLREYDNA
jgi:phage-related protein